MLFKGKSAINAIFYVITKSFCFISSDSYSQLTKYPSFDQLWTVFGNLYFAQYLKSISILDKYKQGIKYFHGHLLLFI